jgi:hypothetical protein
MFMRGMTFFSFVGLLQEWCLPSSHPESGVLKEVVQVCQPHPKMLCAYGAFFVAEQHALDERSGKGEVFTFTGPPGWLGNCKSADCTDENRNAFPEYEYDELPVCP